MRLLNVAAGIKIAFGMQFLQLLGLLIMINALTIAWWFQANAKLGVIGLTLAVVALLVGLALTVHERAWEVTFGKYGGIKAAAAQANADAGEIAKIRERVESQAATMDLVAQQSNQAKKLLADMQAANQLADEKSKELEKQIAEAKDLASPPFLTFFGADLNPEKQELCGRIFFKSSKNVALGRLRFTVELLEPATAKIISIAPSLATGPYNGSRDNPIALDGKSGTVEYSPIGGGEHASIEITVSEEAVVRISGNLLKESKNVRIVRAKD